MKPSFDFCICSLLLIALFSSFVECKVRKRGKQNSVSRNRTSNGDNERRTRRSESDASRSTTPSPQIRAQRLVQQLLGNYTKVVRPRLNQSQTVNIYFDIRIKQLVNVDVKSSQVQFSICLWQQWVDDGLQWDYDKYGGRYTMLNPNDIWIPDVMFINSVDNFEHLKEITALPVRVNWMGKVLWQIPLLKTTRCNMDVRYFPYDIQTCYLDLSSWRMLGSEINLEFMEDYSGEAGEEVAKFRHPEWNLIYVDKIRKVQGWEGYEVPILKFKYAFHRQSKYFEYTMVYPTVLICLMAFISFNLPNDCGEKIGFSITILLALVLNLCLIGGYIPHASVNFPIMAEFFFGGICAVSASVVQSVMILLMYHSSEKPKEPSKLMRKVILGWLAKVTFTSLKGLENDHMLEDDNSSEQEKSSTKEENDTKKISASDFADAVLVISNHIKQSQQEISESESENLPSTASELLLNSLYNVQVSARNWVAREQEDRNEHFIKLQWKLIAQVFDRLLMIFFTFICAGCGLAFKLRFYMGEQAALSQFPKKEEEADDYYYYYYDYDYNYENLAVN